MTDLDVWLAAYLAALAGGHDCDLRDIAFNAVDDWREAKEIYSDAEN